MEGKVQRSWYINNLGKIIQITSNKTANESAVIFRRLRLRNLLYLGLMHVG